MVKSKYSFKDDIGLTDDLGDIYLICKIYKKSVVAKA